MSDESKPDESRVLPSAMTAPLGTTVPRRAGSIRRTSHIDMLFGGAGADRPGGLTLDGAARDLVTHATGQIETDRAHVHATVGSGHTLAALATTPARAQGDQLLGLIVAGGFRDAVHRLFPSDVAAGNPLSLLLDDLPVAALISGYAHLYSGALPPDQGGYNLKSDICSGWRSEGTMLVAAREHGAIPVPLGPPAPPLEPASDPLGWHDIAPLGTGSMRRRRLVDVTVGEQWEVRAMFRDTHVDTTGEETVLHEYSLTAVVDPDTSIVLACDAVPRVLPWVECPVAAASATRLVGHHVGEVRNLVRAELRGTSTCTHLNDLLRSLGDVGTLVATLHTTLAAPPAGG
ncbi:MAG: DUF2889 domain-containing protein [Actinomycetota bacterium]|nr:DUF2889 domain-containing protein [Actinomycetota bacterium]